MAVTKVAGGTQITVGGAATVSGSPAAPTHATGDLIIVTACWDSGNNTAASSGITATAGWTAAADTAEQTTAATFLFIKHFYKFAASAAESMPTISFSGANTGNSGHSFILVAGTWRGVDTTTPFGTSGATVTDGTADTSHLAIPSPGTVPSGDAVLGFELRSDDGVTYTLPAGWTQHHSGVAGTTTLGGDAGSASAYKEQASTSDPGSLTYTGTVASTLGVGRMWVLQQVVTATPKEQPFPKRPHRGLIMRGRRAA